MMRSRRLFRAAGIVALAAMCFAQAAFAIAACEPARMSSIALIVAAQESEHACHEPADNVNLCLTHSQASDQTLDKHQVRVPDVSASVVLLVRAFPEAPEPRSWLPRPPLPAAGPPPRILFRTLLI